MEKDDEVAGNGNSYTAEFWQYDSRLGRRWNIDPVTISFQSPYTCLNDNPIYLVDPRGNSAGDYYSKSGHYLGSDGIDDKKVYTVDGFCEGTDMKNVNLSQESLNKIRTGTHATLTGTLLNMTHDEFKTLVGTVYVESDVTHYTWEEAAGITDVIENRMSLSGQSMMNILSTSGIYGYQDAEGVQASMTTISGTNASNSIQKLVTVRQGVIAALLSPNDVYDYSGGGTSWQGRDFAIRGTNAYNGYYAVGFQFTDPNHDIFRMGNYQHSAYQFSYTTYGITVSMSTPYKYLSTGAAGKTVFMRVDAGWIFSQYPVLSNAYFNKDHDTHKKIWNNIKHNTF